MMQSDVGAGGNPGTEFRTGPERTPRATYREGSRRWIPARRQSDEEKPGPGSRVSGHRPPSGWILVAALTAAAVLAAMGGLAESGDATRPGTSGVASHAGARLLASSCGGPTGTLFVAEAGYDAVGIIDTSTCTYTGTYNVGDTAASNQPTDTDYASTDEAIAVVGKNLYFADAGTSDVAVVTSGSFASLPKGDYTPPEKLIDVGFFPEDLAATPDGAQVWVTDTGPETGTAGPGFGASGAGTGSEGTGSANGNHPGSPEGQGTVPFTAVSVITTASDSVVGNLQLSSPPQAVAFSPNGQAAYVTTGDQLLVVDVASRRIVGQVDGLQGAHGVAVAPDGLDVYVTDSAAGTVSVIDATTLRVTRTITVGQLPWTVVLSSSGATAYVADPDSDAVSIIDTASGSVSTLTIVGDPESLALSPNGTTLWVGQGEGSHVVVVTTSNDTETGAVELGFSGPQSGDGLEPTGLAFIG
ncbi:MAG TPA: hypothetical protein VMD28_04920 [Acidimicrobiales bacterium]|nr:hypothetical protein [Acidimicrobiales bacterium]